MIKAYLIGAIIVLTEAALIRNRRTLVGKVFFFIGLVVVAIYVVRETTFVSEFLTALTEGLYAN